MKRKMIVLSSVLIVAIGSTVVYGQELMLNSFNSEVHETLLSGDIAKITSLNEAFIHDNKDLDFNKLEKLLNRESISEDVKCYYIDGFRTIADTNRIADSYEIEIQRIIGSNKLSSNVISYALSTIRSSENLNVQLMDRFYQSSDEKVKMSTLSTMSHLGIEKGYEIIRKELNSSTDSIEKLTLLTLASRFDSFESISTMEVDKVNNENFNVAQKEQLAFVLGKTKNPEMLNRINNLLSESNHNFQEYVYLNSIDLIEKASRVDNLDSQVDIVLKRLNVNTINEVKTLENDK